MPQLLQNLPRGNLKIAGAASFLLFLAALLLLHNNRSEPPLIHLVPHSHLDAGWKRTQQQTFHSAAVPIFKRTLIELLLDSRRTAVFDPLIFVTSWINNSGDSPLSISSAVDGGFTNPMEMYVEAVKNALAERAKSLEPGVRQNIQHLTLYKSDTSHLWKWTDLPRYSFEAIAAVLHDHEDLPPERVLNSLVALLLEDDLIHDNISELFLYGTTAVAPGSVDSPAHVSENAIMVFVDDFSDKLQKLKQYMRKGDAKSRSFESASLTKLFSVIEMICGEYDCSHKCDTIAKEIGAPGKLFNEENCRLPSYRQIVKYLVEETKQLELVGSGWVAVDESLTSFEEVVDCATLGKSAVRTIMDLEPPTIAWQVDSFGHSLTMARAWKQLNMRAAVFNRVSYEKKSKILDEGGTLFRWKVGFDQVIDSTNLLLGRGKGRGRGKGKGEQKEGDIDFLPSILLHDHYNSPVTNRFEGLLHGRDGGGSGGLKSIADEAAESIASFYGVNKKHFPTRHVLYPVGGDEMFLNAASHYDGLDEVINLLNSKHGLTAKFSTPTIFLDDIESELAKDSSSIQPIPTIWSDSLLQYSDKMFNDWSGFYSSRPFLKHQIRSFSNMMFAAEMLHAMAIIKGDRIVIERDSKGTNPDASADHENHKKEALARHYRMKSARGIFAALLHHDAITGTCTNEVEHDYLTSIADGRFATSSVIISSLRAMNKLTLGEGEEKDQHSQEKVVALGGGGTGSILHGYAQLGIGAVLGRDGEIDLVILNTKTSGDQTREVSIVVPCFVKSVQEGDEGQWTAHYNDEISNGVVITQLLPIFEATEGGYMRLQGETGKAKFCRLIMAVEGIGFLAGRKVKVMWTKSSPQGANHHSATGDGANLLLSRGLVDSVVTGGELASYNSNIHHLFRPSTTTSCTGGGCVEVEVIFKPKGNRMKIEAAVRSDTLPFGMGIEYRELVSFPFLGVLTSGTYISKWAGAGTLLVWGGLILWHWVGLFTAIAVGICLRRAKQRRKVGTRSDGGDHPSERENRPASLKGTKKPILIAVTGLLLGVGFANIFLGGGFDSLLKPIATNHMTTTTTTTTILKSSEHAESAPFLFEEKIDELRGSKGGKDGQVDEQEESMAASVPGFLLVKQVGFTSGALLAIGSGAVAALSVTTLSTAVIFAPIFSLSAIYTCLSQPLEQSREMSFKKLPHVVHGDVGGGLGDGDIPGSEAVVAMSDGPLVFQVSFLASDNIVSTITHYKSDGLLAQKQKDDGMFFHVDSSVNPGKLDVETLLRVTDHHTAKENHHPSRHNIVVDDGVSLTAVKRKSALSFVNSNFYPFQQSASWRSSAVTGGGGVKASLGSSVITSQPLGICGPSDGIYDVMLSRSFTEDDKRGVEEPLRDSRSFISTVGVKLSAVENGGGSWDDVTEARKLAFEHFRRPPIVIGNALKSKNIWSDEKSADFSNDSVGVGVGVGGKDQATTMGVRQALLPPQLEVLSFQFWTNGELSRVGGGRGRESDNKGMMFNSAYIRIENIEVGLHAKPKIADLKWILKPHKVISIREVNMDFSEIVNSSDDDKKEEETTTVEIKPRQIKAYRLSF